MLSLSMLLIASKMSYACGGEQVPAPSPLGLPQWAEEGCSGRLVSCPAPGLLQGAPEGSWVHACSSGAWPPLVLGPSPPVSVAPCSSATEDVWAACPSLSTGPTTGEGLPQVRAWCCWCGASAPCSRTRPGELRCHLMWSMRLPRAVPPTPCFQRGGRLPSGRWGWREMLSVPALSGSPRAQSGCSNLNSVLNKIK